MKQRMMPLMRRLAAGLAAFTTAAAFAVCVSAEREDVVLDGSDSQQEANYQVSGDYKYTTLVSAENIERRAVQIEKYTGSAENLEIPSELEGMPVVSLGEYAFVSANTLKTVTIPASVENLGTFAFADCVALTDFYAAEDNPLYKSKDGVLYNKDETVLHRYPVGRRPKEVTVEEGVEEIGNVAFTSCGYMESLTLPSTLNYIGVSAFAECVRLTSVTIPNKVKEIAAFAFNSCTNLVRADLPVGLESIGNAAFAGTGLLDITIPDTCVYIGQQAFAHTKLTSVTIPKSVTDIGLSAFGWTLNAESELAPDSSFIIRGYSGTAAQTYANDSEEGNNFKFVNLGASEKPAQTSAASEPEKTGMSTGRIIGIAVCGVLLAGIAAAAVISGVKSKQKKTQDNDNADDDTEEE